MDEKIDLNFSQRNGFAELPTQLKLGELPLKTRYSVAEIIRYVVQRNIDYGGNFLTTPINSLFKYLWINEFELPPSQFQNDPYSWKGLLEKQCANLPVNEFFDLLEFLCKSPIFTDLEKSLPNLLEQHYSAYSFIGGQFIAVGNKESAEAFQVATEQLERDGHNAAKAHLSNSAKHLRNGKWADSVRESIHAVESVVKKMDIKGNTLGAALSEIKNKGYIHDALKSGFSSLYGYTSDEGGIRHALLEGGTPNVSQADAIYMMGSCASFVSYLIAQKIPQKRD